MPLTRSDLQQLSALRLAEAQALLAAGLWDGAYYLAGYVVEYALKACVAKQTVAEEFPDKERAYKAFTHRIEDLVKLAGLRADRDKRSAADPEFQLNFAAAEEWDENARYERWDEAQARALVTAITDPTHGVLPWITAWW